MTCFTISIKNTIRRHAFVNYPHISIVIIIIVELLYNYIKNFQGGMDSRHFITANQKDKLLSIQVINLDNATGVIPWDHHFQSYT